VADRLAERTVPFDRKSHGWRESSNRGDAMSMSSASVMRLLAKTRRA
jgi:hypothetical protein